MGKHALSAISGALVAGVALVAIAFFWQNPFRVGELNFERPDGTSVSFKVANSNDISELIRKGLKNKNSAAYLTNALLSIIEDLSSDNRLGEKLVDLAERRKGPFFLNSVPVKLVYDQRIGQGFAAVCEHSRFSGKNVVVFVIRDDDNTLVATLHAYAAMKLEFPCPSKNEILRINSPDFNELNHHMVLAKRTL